MSFTKEQIDQVAAKARQPYTGDDKNRPLSEALQRASGLRAALAAQPVVVARKEPPTLPVQTWGVTVTANGVAILTIETNHLSGIENISDYADTVRDCAHHLLAFIGDPAQPVVGEADQRVAILHELNMSGFVLCPRVAPDKAFDAAWGVLGREQHRTIRDKISIDDARRFFRAVWHSMVCSFDDGEKARSEALHKASAARSEAADER